MLTRKMNTFGTGMLFLCFALWLVAGASFTGCSKPEGSCTTQADCDGKDCRNGKCETTSGCKTNEDCKAEKKATCANGKCQGCLDDSVCDTAAGERCSSSNTCLKGCEKTSDCAYLGKNKVGVEAKCLLNQCILPCVSHTECPDDSYCKSQACAKGARPNTKERDELEPCGNVENDKKCKADSDCKEGNVCDRGLCWANCLDGLNCKTWSGGSTSYCYKPCAAGCGDKVCVKAEQFAEDTEVCMRKVTKQGEQFNYNQGTYCDTDNGLQPLQPPRGQPGFGQGRCWAICDATNTCEVGRECGTIAMNTEGKPIFACLKPCKSTDDCDGITGLVCKPHTADCKTNEDCGTLGPCESGKCKGKNVCVPR